MNRYKFIFTGRKAGALGQTLKCAATYKAESLGKAIWMLYNEYEHISYEKVTENSKAIDPEVVSFTKIDNR